MFKKKAILIIATFIIFAFSIKTFANFETENEKAEWKVSITNDTKDLEDTQEINFKIINNENVVAGKLAPGTTAVAEIEINFTGTNVPIEFLATIKDLNLPDCFKLTAKLDDEDYDFNSTKVFELKNQNSFNDNTGKKFLYLILEWQSDKSNALDTELGVKADTISIPITIKVRQYI